MRRGNNTPGIIDEVYETVLKLSKDIEISMSEKNIVIKILKKIN